MTSPTAEPISPLPGDNPSIVVQPTEKDTATSEDEQNVPEEGTLTELTEEETAEIEEKEKIKALQLNVKTVKPSEDGSEIKKAIKAENWERLEYLMDLGEFNVDRSSLMARLFSQKGQSGLTVLAKLCIELSAPQCMMGLIRWARNPDHRYWINEKDLFQYAKQVALKGNVVCCIELMEPKGTKDSDMIKLANLLYPHVRSIELGARLAKFMFGKWKHVFFYPHLVYQCSIPGIHPALVAMSTQLIIEAGDSFDIPGYVYRDGFANKVPTPNDGKKRAPLSEAARVLNTDIVRLLTHNSLIVNNLQNNIIKKWRETAEINPLFTLLKQDFSFLAPADNASSDRADEEEEQEEEDKLISHPDDEQVYFQLHRAGHAMLECLRLLKQRIREIEGYNSTDYADMYQVACDIYAATVRELTIRQIRRHLPLSAQAKLIELTPEPQQTEGQETPTQANPQGEKASDDENNESPTKKYKFLPTINGTFLRKTLENYDIELHPVFTTEVWTYLVEYENIKTIEAKIKSKIENPKTTPSSAILYEYILDPDSRTTIVEQIPRDSVSSASEAGTTDSEVDDKPLRGSWSGVVKFGAAGGGAV